MKRKTRPLAQRFFEKVKRTSGCWLWVGCGTGSAGYGKILLRTGVLIGAHRASWIVHFGKIPRNKWVLHRYDNRRCVNPAHLFLGTQKDNMRDASAKGRIYRGGAHNPARGEQNFSAKWTEREVKMARAMASTGVSHQRIADHFGHSRRSASRNITGARWKHVL